MCSRSIYKILDDIQQDMIYDSKACDPEFQWMVRFERNEHEHDKIHFKQAELIGAFTIT